MAQPKQLTIKQSLSQAKKAAQRGDVGVALQLYNAVLQNQPNNLVAKKGLRKLQKRLPPSQSVQTQPANPSQDKINTLINLYNSGQMVKLELVCKKILKIYPQSFFVYNVLGAAFQGQGKLQKAVQAFEQAIQLKPDDAEVYNNRGVTLSDLGQREKAVRSYDHAIQLKSDYAEAYNNRGNALSDLGNLEEAVSDYDKAIQLNPGYAEAHSNRGNALEKLGELVKALKSYENVVRLKPGSVKAYFDFLGLLNFYTPPVDILEPYVKAQMQLRQLDVGSGLGSKISDEKVKEIYNEAQYILSRFGVQINTGLTQLYRGKVFDKHCSRNKKVFDTFKAIPQSCFNCYKVVPKPRTVVELIKLLLAFNEIDLESDNTRKCIVEIRPKVAGSYKGFVYCNTLDEASSVQKIVKDIVSQRISDEIPVIIKRGCSEFELEYPEYGCINDNFDKPMTYNDAWLKYEEEIDVRSAPIMEHDVNQFTHNHLGLTLLDAIVIRTWVSYAATIADKSYKKITSLPVTKLHIDRLSSN